MAIKNRIAKKISIKKVETKRNDLKRGYFTIQSSNIRTQNNLQ